MQAKLDELIRAQKGARTQFIGIEHQSDRQIEKIRADLEEECGEDQKDSSSAEESVERLRRRF